MSTRTLLVLPLVAALAACGHDKPGAETAATEAAKPLLLVNEDLLTASEGTLSQGPVVSGSLQPERQADLRAEVSGIVLQVLKENGDPVKKGDLLLRIDPTSIRDQLMSAEESARAAEVAQAQAESTLKRWKAMAGKGLVAAETIEAAEVKKNQAIADLASAKARLVQARQQLEKTEVRAPFDGIVGAREVSAGDTAQIGKELVKVVDPTSMRFEGFVATEQIGKVKTGNAVSFRVNGYPDRTFDGQILRVNPIADINTRQVQVLVSVPAGESLVAGLFAEGRIQIDSVSAVLLPETALIKDGDKHYVWRVRSNTLNRVPVVLGGRNERDGQYAIQSGVEAGDQVLRYPQGALKDGIKVQINPTGGTTVAAATSN